MPSKTSSKPPEPRRPALDDIDSYLLEEDFDLDPFKSPSPDAGKNKRKEPGGLGIDEEVEVKKRATVPRVKLDEARLLSDKGIPELRRREKHLKLKGKGHEFSDAARLLSFYQLWLDDLFPKAKFLDALAMVEKAGHKTSMHKRRMDWINEGKPKTTAEDDYDFPEGPSLPAREPARIAPIFEKRPETAARATTPNMDNPFGDDDIYNATPRAKTTERTNGGAPDGDELDALMAQDEPDDDEMDALMAQEAEEAQRARRSNGVNSAPRLLNSIFGGVPDEDELDALMAEAEAEAEAPVRQNGKGTQEARVIDSIFGDGKPKNPSNTVDEADDMDDLDALMAGAEGNDHLSRSPVAAATSAQKGPDPATEAFGDDEAAMAEMDGLWDEPVK